MIKYYSGVGSRETPMYILYMMSKLAIIFEKQGFILRSGCALGADSAFEDALLNPVKTAEIYIPYKAFPGKMGTKYKNHYICPQDRFNEGGFNSLFRQATRLIHKHEIHRAWRRLSERIMLLHNRNMFQVLGQDLNTKSNFTVCYTKAGETKYEETTQRTGGTGTAINASDIFGVETFNLGKSEHYIRLSKFIEKYDHLIDYERLNKMVPRTDFNKKGKYEVDFITDYNGHMETIKNDKKRRDIKVGLRKEENVLKKNKTRKIRP